MRILVADDNQDSALTLAVLLRAWGYSPQVVHDGKAALACLREPDAPTLALLDWVMPGLDGIEICRQVRQDTGRPYTYVILVTGRGGKDQMVDGLNAGADDYLIKPIDTDELQARLHTARRILALQEQLLATQRLLREQASRDSLTGLWNRAMILEILERELARSRRERQPVAVILADLDHFKRINDTHGHLAGDCVLRQAGQRLRTALRPYDTVGRYGGEEFLVVLSGCGTSAALMLAERLRQAMEVELRTDRDQALQTTLSLGVSVWDGRATTEELVRAADDALYEAKRSGRNCVRNAGLLDAHPI